ncbi:hypothetical protein BJ742DRAFT_131313 [Cladochytrium replicatum]|nr:hypothetical protein BJ742DRAFT_131313 [Cladochytrium replicatum]
MAPIHERSGMAENKEGLFELCEVRENAKVRAFDTAGAAQLELPPKVNLLSVSQSYGFAVYASDKGLHYVETKSIGGAAHAADKGKIANLDGVAVTPLPKGSGGVYHVRLSGNDLIVCVGTKAGQLLNCASGNVSISDVAPNPSADSDTTAILVSDGFVLIHSDQSGLKPLPVSNVTSICWSTKGKQIACGTRGGTILQFQPDGQQKNTLPSPSNISDPVNVAGLLWIETAVFFVVYATVDDEGYVMDLVYYVLSQTKVGDVKNIVHKEIIDAPMENAPHVYLQLLRNWRQSYTVFLAYSNSESINVFGCEPGGGWSVYEIEEVKRASVPLDPESQEQTHIVGLAIDYTNEILLPPPPGADPLPPLPLFMFLTDAGVFCAYHVANLEAVKSGILPPMVKPASLPSSAGSGSTSTLGKPSAPGTGFPTMSSSPGEATPVGTNVFGKPSFGGAAPSFGIPSFGTPSLGGGAAGTSVSGTPAFGAPSLGGTPSFGEGPSFSSTTLGSLTSGQSTTPSFGSSLGFVSGKPLGSLAATPGGSAAKPDAPTPTPAPQFGLKPATTLGSTTGTPTQPASTSASKFGLDSSKLGSSTTSAAAPTLSQTAANPLQSALKPSGGFGALFGSLRR